jgi:hypothetical protein
MTEQNQKQLGKTLWNIAEKLDALKTGHQNRNRAGKVGKGGLYASLANYH